jgi:hypothetical protein
MTVNEYWIIFSKLRAIVIVVVTRSGLERKMRLNELLKGDELI